MNLTWHRSQNFPFQFCPARCSKAQRRQMKVDLNVNIHILSGSDVQTRRRVSQSCECLPHIYERHRKGQHVCILRRVVL